MAKKTPTILLTFLPFYVPAGDNDPHWRVDQVTDSLAHNPSDILSRAQVDALCASDEWKVTIKPTPPR